MARQTPPRRGRLSRGAGDSPAARFTLNHQLDLADADAMFTVYALNLSDRASDTVAECATLDEALTRPRGRELVLNELADPDGPNFDRYGFHLTPCAR